MKALPIGWVAGIALMAAQTVWAGDCSEPGLGQDLGFTNNAVEYNISHTTDPASTHRVSLANVSNIQANLISSYGIYVNDMGFRTPYLNTMPDYNVILKNDWWYAEPGCVVLHAVDIRNESEEYVRNVTFHERFHTVQRHYRCDVADCDSGYMNGTFGSWTSEGSNDAMMDKGYPDLDDLTGYPFYENSAHAYLNAPYTSLFDQAYHACLFWNYAMEQFGTLAVEPRIGVDFLRRFYERFAANGSAGSASSRAALEQTIANAGGPSLHECFLDFSICNYVRGTTRPDWPTAPATATSTSRPSRFSVLCPSPRSPRCRPRATTGRSRISPRATTNTSCPRPAGARWSASRPTTPGPPWASPPWPWTRAAR